MPDTLSQESNRKFSDMRAQVFIQSMLPFLYRKPMELLPFEDVRKMLGLTHVRKLGLQDVPLDKIVGSMGRYDDFTREFLPRKTSQESRWRTVYDLSTSMEGFPPVELYKIDEAYFVRDGNHRVSVAQANNAESIEAYVTEYITPVDVSPDDTLDEILIKAGAANFTQATNLGKLRPDHNIRLTNPGRYKYLLRHIAVHKYYREIECGCEISWEEAVASWYDNVYLPLVKEIRTRDILKDFPNRTEADLYAWLVYHRERLEEQYGIGQVDDGSVVDALEEEAKASPIQKVERAIKRKLDPDSLPPTVE